jgi:hypothetical protein
MTNAIISAVYSVGGKTFNTKAEAQEYIRKPAVIAALNALTQNNQELTDALYEKRESVEIAFETGVIRRVSKTEYNQLRKALDHLKEVGANDKKLSFLVENAETVYESFRWPAVKRLTPEEKVAAATRGLAVAFDGREDVATWIVTNKDAILEAFKAGIEKREVPASAANGLAAYRAKMAERKSALEAAKAEGGDEAVAALRAKYAAEDAAAKAAPAA